MDALLLQLSFSICSKGSDGGSDQPRQTERQFLVLDDCSVPCTRAP